MMKINKFSKTLMAALLAVTLIGCSNSDAPDTNTQNVTESEQADDKVSDAIEEEKPEKVESDDAGQVAESNQLDQENENKDEENTDQAKEDENTEVNTAENTDPSEDMIIEGREGIYFSSLVASNNGDRSDDEYGSPYLSDVRIEDNILTVDGTIDYRDNPEDRENVQKYEKGTFHFELSPDVTLQAVGGLAEPEYFTKEEFVEYYNGVKDSGLGFIIEVKDELVTTVSISS